MRVSERVQNEMDVLEAVYGPDFKQQQQENKMTMLIKLAKTSVVTLVVREDYPRSSVVVHVNRDHQQQSDHEVWAEQRTRAFSSSKGVDHNEEGALLQLVEKAKEYL
jgi:hypothetical protein